MAEWGARIRNRATGSIQIDTSYYNLAQVQKTTLTSVRQTANSGNTISLTVTSADFPLVATSSADFVALLNIVRSGNDWTFNYFTAATGQNVTFYIFGKPPVITTPGWGKRIKRGSQVIYDSRHHYAASAARYSLDYYAAFSQSLATGKTYAVAQNQHLGEYSLIESQVQGVWRRTTARAGLGIKIAGNVISSGNVSMGGASEQIPQPGVPAQVSRVWRYGTLRVLDVTGF